MSTEDEEQPRRKGEGSGADRAKLQHFHRDADHPRQQIQSRHSHSSSDRSPSDRLESADTFSEIVHSDHSVLNHTHFEHSDSAPGHSRLDHSEHSEHPEFIEHSHSDHDHSDSEHLHFGHSHSGHSHSGHSHSGHSHSGHSHSGHSHPGHSHSDHSHSGHSHSDRSHSEHSHSHSHPIRSKSGFPLRRRKLPDAPFDTLFLEPIGGIAGDMFLAACLDLGVDFEEFKAQLASLGLSGYSLKLKGDERAGILGTHLEVVLEEEQPHHRAYSEIVEMIEKSALSSRAKAAAQSVFRVIGDAEAHVHGVSIEDIHFHEVGAVDAIVDICGAAICLELMGWPQVLSLPPPSGGGSTRSAHGIIPIPAPATIQIMAGRKFRPSGPGERTTPTGAALLKALARESEAFPDVVIEQVGYGVGTKHFNDSPNILRAVLGRAAQGHRQSSVVLVEANLDDTSGEILADSLDSLLKAGAADVWITPMLTKKGRPGHVISALVDSGALDAVQDCFLRELPTFGIRHSPWQRRVLDRRWEEVSTPFGEVRLKLGLKDGTVLHVSPEYEDCLKRAKEAGVPVLAVYREALAAWKGA